MKLGDIRKKKKEEIKSRIVIFRHPCMGKRRIISLQLLCYVVPFGNLPYGKFRWLSVSVKRHSSTTYKSHQCLESSCYLYRFLTKDNFDSPVVDSSMCGRLY